MSRVETFIRTTELGFALASTYMTAVTLLQTSIYMKLKPFLLPILHFIEVLLGGLLLDPILLDFLIIILVLFLSFSFWRRGDLPGFGRLFSLNMLMFFPSVIDFSMFNWVNLILPYEPTLKVTPLWVFAVGVLLQTTYVALIFTVRFRSIRQEFLERGAELEDVDSVSRGQMSYLAVLLTGTTAVIVLLYYAVPLTKDLLRLEFQGLPYPHLIIGVVCTLLITVSIVLYIRSFRSETEQA
jgi:hypothetical protein